MSKNITRKELKKPDQFISFLTRYSLKAQEVLASQRRAVIIGAAVLVGVVALVIVFAQVRARGAERDSAALARVDKIATADMLPAGATADASKNDGLPHFKTEKERLEGALKELDVFLAAHPRSRLRAAALVHRGAYLLDLQRPDEAIRVYVDLLADDGLDKRLRFIVLEGLGYAYEAKGDLDKAATTFAGLGEDTAAKASGGFYQDRALYHKARIAEVRGNRADALKLYREVLEKVPTTPLRDDISNRVAVLEQK